MVGRGIALQSSGPGPTYRPPDSGTRSPTRPSTSTSVASASGRPTQPAGLGTTSPFGTARPVSACSIARQAPQSHDTPVSPAALPMAPPPKSEPPSDPPCVRPRSSGRATSTRRPVALPLNAPGPGPGAYSPDAQNAVLSTTRNARAASVVTAAVASSVSLHVRLWTGTRVLLRQRAAPLRWDRVRVRGTARSACSALLQSLRQCSAEEGRTRHGWDREEVPSGWLA